MKIGDAQKAIFLLNFLLVLGIGGVVASMVVKKEEPLRQPAERPEIEVNQGPDIDRRSFERDYGVCWNWVPKPTVVRVASCQRCGMTLPSSGTHQCKTSGPRPLSEMIKIDELNSASSPQLGHIVFGYTGLPPGKERGKASPGQQKVHQYVFSASPFLLSDNRLVRLVGVVKSKDKIGAWFQIQGGEKEFVSYTPAPSELPQGGASGQAPGRSGSSSNGGPPPDVRTSSKYRDQQTALTAPGRWRVGRQDWEDAYRNRQRYISELSPIVLRDQNTGEILGLQLKSSGESTLAHRFGFRSNDIVRRIMGQPVRSLDDLNRILDENQTTATGSVEIERKGRRIQLQFQLVP